MLKHLIEFNGKKIALDKQEIGALYQAIEPYFVAIAMGLNDVDIPGFVKDYNQDISGSRQLVKQNKTPELAQTPKEEVKKEYYEDNIYDMSRYRENG